VSQVIKAGKKAVYPILYEVHYGQIKSINCFLYKNGDTLTLIDAGIDLPAFHDFFHEKLTEYGFTIHDIDQILLTHHHGDHTGVINSILSQKIVPIYAHYLAIERLHLTKEFQLKKRDFFIQLYKNYGCLHLADQRLAKLEKTLQESEQLRINTDIIPLQDGAIVGDFQVKAVPGHSPDSILFYDPETKWLFAGDLVLYTGTTSALVDHDKEGQLLPTVMQYKQSLESCLLYNTNVVFAGHQQPFDNLQEIVQKNLNRIDFQLRRIAEKIAEGNETALAIAFAIYGERTEKEFSIVLSEIISYTLFAEMAGLVTKEMHEDGWHFSLQY
jgi:glyoxylase-like metal-dependent hydrolase (beta-lactamase superfamily II)